MRIAKAFLNSIFILSIPFWILPAIFLGVWFDAIDGDEVNKMLAGENWFWED